jgi:Mg/Co/Ni transporter MgtE
LTTASSSRTRLLVGLLLLQSVSGFILQAFRDHALDDREYFFMSLFLTMLVGAGGNAGNQAAVSVICAMAQGTFSAGDTPHAAQVIAREVCHARA